MLIRTPFFQKIGILLKAMIELIDWEGFYLSVE